MNRSLQIYIALVTAAFWLGLGAAVWAGAADGLQPIQLAPLFGLAVAVEALGVRKQENTIGFSAVAHLATAVLYGPVAAAVVAAGAVLLVDGVRAGRRSYILMNSSMFGIAAGAAGIAFQLAGGSVGPVASGEAAALTVLIAARLLVNELIFSGAVSMLGAPFRQVFRDNLRDSVGQSIGEGCLGVLLAFGYTAASWAILPFLVPLLAALYQAQAGYERLKSETTAALDAFASVIDERDPLTSQHSERVADLVARFADAIGLPDRESKRLVAAARFHDLGKVAIEVATLSKEGRLTEEELRAIRSHPRLSARLLSPFGFAEQMALYAELHHERYDGRGYYAVSQSEIPVEAHVLIAADSYDAMTSKRAYRPALSVPEAVAELRHKAGSQFHPLVAQAFAAMIEGGDVTAAIGRQQLAALRAEFSTVPLVRWPDLGRLLRPGLLVVYLAAAALITAGIPGLPLWPPMILAALGFAAGGVSVAQTLRIRRRRMAALAVIAAGGGAQPALAAAGIVGWSLWLDYDREGFRYRPLDAPAPLGDHELDELCKRALRQGARGERGTLTDGTRVEITPEDGSGLRLAVGTAQPLSAADSALLREIAERTCSPQPATQSQLTVLEGDQRTPLANWQVAVIIVELGAFEDVRQVSGHLSAERMASDAVARLRALLRAGDRLHQLDDDRFGIVINVTDPNQVEALCRRMSASLDDLPVPRRANQVRPLIRSAMAGAIAVDAEMAGLLNGFEPSQLRRAG